jgi:hypothetical protein
MIYFLVSTIFYKKFVDLIRSYIGAAKLSKALFLNVLKHSKEESFAYLFCQLGIVFCYFSSFHAKTDDKISIRSEFKHKLGAWRVPSIIFGEQFVP